MNTHEYLVDLARREKIAALQGRMRSMTPDEMVKFAHQRGVDLVKLSGVRGAAVGAGAGGLAGFLTDMAVNAGNPLRRTVQEMAEYGPGADGVIRRTIDLKPQIKNLGAAGNRNVPAQTFFGVNDLPPKYTTEALTGGGAALGAGIGHLIEQSKKPVSSNVEALGEKIKAILSSIHMGEKHAGVRGAAAGAAAAPIASLAHALKYYTNAKGITLGQGLKEFGTDVAKRPLGYARHYGGITAKGALGGHGLEEMGRNLGKGPAGADMGRFLSQGVGGLAGELRAIVLGMERELPEEFLFHKVVQDGAAGIGVGDLAYTGAQKLKQLLQKTGSVEKTAQASFLGSVLNTGSGLLRNLGVARAGLQAAQRFTGNRGLGYTIGSLIANPQSSVAFNKAMAGGFGDFGRGAFSQAARAGKAAIQPGGSFSGIGQQFLGATEQLANSVNRFGREAFGAKSFQRHMAQQGYKVPGRGAAIWDALNKQRSLF